MTTSEQVTHGREHLEAGQIVRLIAIALIGAAIIALALDNRHDVRLGYVFGDATAPAWIVVAASAIGGIAIGWLIRHRPGRRRGR